MSKTFISQLHAIFFLEFWKLVDGCLSVGSYWPHTILLPDLALFQKRNIGSTRERLDHPWPYLNTM